MFMKDPWMLFLKYYALFEMVPLCWRNLSFLFCVQMHFCSICHACISLMSFDALFLLPIAWWCYWYPWFQFLGTSNFRAHDGCMLLLFETLPCPEFPMICLFCCWLRVLNNDDVLFVWNVDVGYDWCWMMNHECWMDVAVNVKTIVAWNLPRIHMSSCSICLCLDVAWCFSISCCCVGLVEFCLADVITWMPCFQNPNTVC
jgi:hypothetical protein